MDITATYIKNLEQAIIDWPLWCNIDHFDVKWWDGKFAESCHKQIELYRQWRGRLSWI